MEIGNAAQWASACATTSAVLVALFKEPFTRWRKRPKLVAYLEAKRPYCVITPNQEKAAGGLPWSGWRYFLRFMIRNEGKSRAEKVEVFLRRVRRKSNGTFVDVLEIPPMNFRWSYSDYDHPEIYADGISPDMGKLCDFVAISDPKTPSLLPLGRPQCLLSLRLEALSPSTEWLPQGQYEFTVKVAASNCPPVTKVFHLHLTGLWDDNPEIMLANGIRFD